MKFLVDAQLPRRITNWFAAAGLSAIHTLDLPAGNRTSDEQINDFIDQNDSVLITKDADFVDSHLLRCRPKRLLLISTGNINNRDLERLLRPLISDVALEFASNSFLELTRLGLVIRK